VLAFDDQALARIFIAGTAVAPEERSEWLREVAGHLDELEAKRARRRARGRRDTADWRARQRNGRVLLRPIVDEVDFAVAAVTAGLLDPNVADDVAALTAAAKKVLDRFARGEFSLSSLADVASVLARLLEAAPHGQDEKPAQRGGDEVQTPSRNAAPARGRAAQPRRAPARR
jgi:hypothetical protein